MIISRCKNINNGTQPKHPLPCNEIISRCDLESEIRGQKRKLWPKNIKYLLSPHYMNRFDVLKNSFWQDPLPNPKAPQSSFHQGRWGCQLLQGLNSQNSNLSSVVHSPWTHVGAKREGGQNLISVSKTMYVYMCACMRKLPIIIPSTSKAIQNKGFH